MCLQVLDKLVHFGRQQGDLDLRGARVCGVRLKLLDDFLLLSYLKHSDREKPNEFLLYRPETFTANHRLRAFWRYPQKRRWQENKWAKPSQSIAKFSGYCQSSVASPCPHLLQQVYFSMSTRPVHDLEARWQQQWELDETYKASKRSDAEPYFCLVEFPFPSGAGIHMGHMRAYIPADVMARRQRMLGKDVLFPIGWDAFGLPTENYAIKNKVRPQDATLENVSNFRRQLQSIGFGFDWSREVDTTDPAYFKWTQWQFLQFVKHGMAYKAISEINWCPKCKIGLANEEAQGGVCERCGNPVEKREKAQWMLSITDYAERLIKGLDQVDYLDKIKAQQKNWIGKSEGATICFATEQDATIEVFTTRPDTLFGVTYVVLAPEHALVDTLTTADHRTEVDAYRAEVARATDEQRLNDNRPKTGVFTGGYAINPVNNERVPVWIADYVLATYGTGAVMAVPAHDERDFAFAKAFGLPMKQVVAEHLVDEKNPPQEGKKTGDRVTVQAIVHHWEKDEVIQLVWKQQPWKTFVIGGVEEGESLEVAIRREVLEETGYTSIASIKRLGFELRSEWFAAHKDENRYARMHIFEVRLADGEQQPIGENEQTIHELHWVPATDILSTYQGVGELPQIWRALQGQEGAFTEAGIAINSGFISEAPTWKAKEEILAWLEEAGNGARKTTYRLRDWVFSRQRYWGEPIPLVKCEACATKKQKVLLIHGFEGSAYVNWFPWMKERLEAQGFEVFAPTMTTSDHPVLEEWLKELAPFMDQLGDQDVIVGHSLGAKAALHLIERAQKKIGSVFLVAPAIGTVQEEDWTRFQTEWGTADVNAVRRFWDAPYNWKKITPFVNGKYVFTSDNDPEILPYMLKDVPKGWFKQVFSGLEHFDDVEIPVLLERVLRTKTTGWIPVPEEQLPLELPPIEAYTPSDDGESPLATMPEWFNTSCPRCGGPAKRETDTMPNWAGSSWYFLRYTDPQNNEAFASDEAMKRWLPIDLYNGGMEHTTLHLLYSRFWHKLLFDMGYIPEVCGDEPYAKRRSQGLVLANDGEKMSKSKGNVVNPDDVAREFGADALRTYILFMGPFDQPVPWDTNGLQGVRRFLDRVWNLYEGEARPEETPDGKILYHQTVKKLTEGIDNLQFNTCVSQLMILSNAYQEAGGIPEVQREGFVQLLAPFAPHLAEELWQKLGKTGSVHLSSWPAYDANALETESYELVVQVNGKVRAKLQVPRSTEEAEACTKALALPEVQRWTGGAPIQKTVFVKGRLLSLTV